MESIQRVRRFIEEHDLLQPGQSVVLGVSGGPDSLCMLDLLHRLSPEWHLKLHVAHLNHGLRPEAGAEAEMVRAEAARRGLPFHTAVEDTRARAEAGRLPIEEAARDLRYAFLARTATAAGAAAVAVAHTADDQAETVLMHFLRGAGMSGLRGMQARSALPPAPGAAASVSGSLLLIRPLLDTTRAEVEAYCVERGLQPAHDATNLDPRYFRNRLRRDLLPELEKYNPNVRVSLCRSAAVLSGEYELLRAAVDKLWRRTAQTTSGKVIFDRAQWQALSVPEQRALLREGVARLQRSPRDIEFAPIEAAVQFSRRAEAGRACDVLGGLTLSISYTHLTLRGGPEVGPLAEDMPLLAADGQLAPGWKFQVAPLRPAAEMTLAAGWQAEIDAARVQLPLRVRGRHEGDTFCPLGLGGRHQKISDYMINVQLEAEVRDRWPLVVSGDDIVWVAGLRLDERFKVTPATGSILRLEFVRETD